MSKPEEVLTFDTGNVRNVMTKNKELRDALNTIILTWNLAERWPDTTEERIALDTAIRKAEEALK